jgi:hypothetical protein
MASTCYQPIANGYPSKSNFNLNFRLSKPPASSDATARGCAARFNHPPVNMPRGMRDRRFQGLPAAGQSLSSGCTADPSKQAEMSDSDDDDDDDSAGDKNTIEVS